MAIKRFVRERSERTEFIDELRDVLVGGSSKLVKGVGDGGVGVYLRFFLSVGNTAYRSGDADVFEYYLRSLFEVVEAGPEGVDCAGLVGRVRGYGFRSIRDFDLAMFGAVVEVVAERKTAETWRTQRAPKVPGTEFTTEWLMTRRTAQRQTQRNDEIIGCPGFGSPLMDFGMASLNLTV